MNHTIAPEDEQMPTAGDLRAQLARSQLRVYEIAPVVGLHPNRISALLNERSPLPADVALRIQRAIEQAQPMERRSR
jgi:plasmid maintenance system antidote protein VapI